MERAALMIHLYLHIFFHSSYSIEVLPDKIQSEGVE